LELTVSRITKSYKGGTYALEQVSLEIGTGMFGLLGRNGAGKSTLLQIMATLLEPTEGEVHYGPYKLGQDNHEIRRLVGYLPQSFGLYNRLTGREFLDYMALLKGMSAPDRSRIVPEMLERVNMAGMADKRIRSYSGGMKQRIGIAQALIGDPQVIIADEPTAGLDPEERVRFRELLEELSIGKTVILSTHIVPDIENSCSRLAILDKGRVQFQGSPDGLLRQVEGRVWIGLLPGPDGAFHTVEGTCIRRRKTSEGYELRVLSESRPFDGAELAEPCLEDGYMLYAGRNARE
jgi:ABC-2 type transport system ATP-binding protein